MKLGCSKVLVVLYLTALGGFTSNVAGAQLEVDQTYQPKLAHPTSRVTNLTVTTNDQIYISGAFDYINGVPKRGFARLNSDRSVDPSVTRRFDANPLPGIVRKDGSMLASNRQFTWINPDWTLGAALPTRLVNCGLTALSGMTLLPDEKLLLVGNFCSASEGLNRFDGSPPMGVVRLTTDGFLDTTFQPLPTDWSSYCYATTGPNGAIFVAAWTPDSPGRQQLLKLLPDGSIDPTFETSLFRPFISLLLAQPDSKLWVGGGVELTNSVVYEGVVRLNPEGSLDTSIPPLNPNGPVYGFTAQADGGFIVSGSFTQFGGLARTNYARVTKEGLVDTHFVTSLPFNFQLAPLNNGQLLAYQWNGGPILRLNPDGSLNRIEPIDLEFNDTVLSVAPEKSGTWLVLTDRQELGPDVLNLQRIHADGSVDPGFAPDLNLPTGPYAPSMAMLPDLDGRVLVALSFGTNGTDLTALLRLKPNGNRDPSFRPPTNILGFPSTLATQPDDKILLGTSGFANSQGGAVLARFNPDGSSDRSFSSPFGGPSQFGEQSLVTQIVVLADGRILVAGKLILAGRTDSVGIVRLQADGTVDASFDLGVQRAVDITFVRHFNLQESGQVLFGTCLPATNGACQPTIVRLDGSGGLVSLTSAPVADQNEPVVMDDVEGGFVWQFWQGNSLSRVREDGSLDPTFGSGPFIKGAVINALGQIVPQPDGAYILAGDFGLGPERTRRNLIKVRRTKHPVAPSILSFQVDQTKGATLSVLTAPDYLYELQSAPVSSATQIPTFLWSTATNLVATGTVIQVSDPRPPVQGGYVYRIGLP